MIYQLSLLLILPNLNKETLMVLFKQVFNREGSLYLVCNKKCALFTSSFRNTLFVLMIVCNALNNLLDTIFFGF